jgi:sec-independent protein translocase protein TatA
VHTDHKENYVGLPELVIILVLIILLFGVGRIGIIAGELGSGVRAFRQGLKGETLPEERAPDEPRAGSDPNA